MNTAIEQPDENQKYLIKKAHENICKAKGNYQYAPTSVEIEKEIEAMIRKSKREILDWLPKL